MIFFRLPELYYWRKVFTLYISRPSISIMKISENVKPPSIDIKMATHMAYVLYIVHIIFTTPVSDGTITIAFLLQEEF